MKRILLSLLLLLFLSSTLLTSASAAVNEVPLSSCDSLDQWSGGKDWLTVSLDTENKTEGEAAVMYTCTLGDKPRHLAVEHRFGPVNVGRCNALAIDFYISDTALFGRCGEAVIELTSSGTCDKEETYWGFNFDIKPGWNTLTMSLTKGDCNLSRINYFRIYANSIQPFTADPIIIGFDNFRCFYDDPEQQKPNVKPQYLGSLMETKENCDTAIPSLTPMTRPDTEIYHSSVLLGVTVALFALAVGSCIWFLISLRSSNKALRICSAMLSLLLLLSGGISTAFYLTPLSRVVQTPIPQMEMALVEEQLTVDPDFDTKESYKMQYVTPEDNGEEWQIPDSLKQYDFKTPTLIKSDRNPEQYYVAVTSVIAFGARGDGEHNDTEAFSTAIDYAKRKGGGTVFVPAGHYVLTAGLTIPQGVSLVGELTPGTVDGTVLLIYGSKGKENGRPAISMEFQSGVKNMAFFYPEQTFVNGTPIPYPPTVRQIGSEGITLENLNFVNSYFAIDMANETLTSNSLQCVRDICGTPLKIGTDNDNSLDIGRFEGIDFSPKYWLFSGFDGVPAQQLLTTWLLRNAIGIRIGRVDWTYYTDIHISGYQTGIEYYRSEAGSANGHLYGAAITDCYYAVTTASASHLNITSSVLSAAGNDGACGVVFLSGSGTKLSLSGCRVTSAGKNAIVNPSGASLSMVGCAVNSNGGTPFVTTSAGLYTAMNTEFVGKATDYVINNAPAEIAPIPTVDYHRTVITKPASAKLVNLGEAPYEIKAETDITQSLQSAIDSLKGVGGIVYIPAGTFKLEGAVTVHEGIEVCGVQDVPHYFPHTTLLTNYGEGQPDAPALFTLKAGAGLRGIGIKYNRIASHGANPPAYSFTVRGDGKGIYVVNCTIPFTYNGVDLATNRCDEHYIDYLWGCTGNVGITVGGGSENGIIRDCMFTQNTSWTVADGNYIGTIQEMLINRSTTFRIGKSKNQIVYHTFVFNAYKGLEIADGAENCFVLSHGTDFGNNAVYLSGNATVTLVDPQLVAHHGSDRSYIHADPTFSGRLDLYNGACWGSPDIAFRLMGPGSYHINQIHIANPGNDVFELQHGALTVNAAARFGATKYDVEVIGSAKSVSFSGSLCITKPVFSIPASVPTSGSDLEKKES